MRNPSRILLLAVLGGAATGVSLAWHFTSRHQGPPKSSVTPSRIPLAEVLNDPPAPSMSERTPQSKHVALAVAAPDCSTAQSASSAEIGSETVDVPTSDAGLVASGASGDARALPPREPAPSPKPQRAYEIVAWGAAADALEADRLCMAGDPIECLRVAELEAVNTNSVREQDKCRAHRERAYSILVLQCHRRNPDACALIARMHSRGVGVAPDSASERALLARSTDLCKKHPGKVCAAFAP